MSENTVRKKNILWNYLIEGFPVVAAAAAAAGLLPEVPYLSLEPGFLLLYFAAYFLAGMLFFCTGREFLMFRILPAIPITVLLISRDLPLFSNAVTALVLFFLLFLLRKAAFWKWGILALFLLLAGIWFFYGNIPGYAAVGLIFLLASMISEFQNHQSRYWAVLLALAAGIAMAFPNSEDPMRWEGVRGFLSRLGNYFVTTYRDIAYFFEDLFDMDGTAYTGYSEAGRLSGGLSDSGREALTFETNAEGHPVYLSGAEFAEIDTDGFSTQVETDLPVNSWLAMYLSALAKSDLTKAEVQCFSRLETGRVTYQYIRTPDLLIPSTVYRIDKGLEYGTEDLKKKGFTYSFNYIALDQANPYFRKLAEQTETAAYEEAARAAADYYGFTLSNYMSKEEYEACLAAYQSQAESKAYRNTAMVTDRMSELVQRITEDCGTDLEKAERIEAYLRQYAYDPSVDLRGRENYVDAFLFEEERGYCVHYASAMVLLLRECGIPSRFVQGFLYTPKEADPEDDDESKGTKKDTAVLERNAHAWVEAYISGLGWIRFEPTAAYENAPDTAWNLLVAEKPAGGQTGEKLDPVSGTDIPKPPEIPIPKDPSASMDGKERRSVWEILRTVGFYLLSVGAVAGLLLVLTLLIRRIRYARLSSEQKLMSDIRTLRRRLDPALPEGVTAESVYDYLPYVQDTELKGRLEELFRGYYRVRFRGDAPDPEFVLNVRQMSREIRFRKKNREGER